MATHQYSIPGRKQVAPATKPAGSLGLPPTVKKDVFLNALLETPTTKQAQRIKFDCQALLPLDPLQARITSAKGRLFFHCVAANSVGIAGDSRGTDDEVALY